MKNINFLLLFFNSLKQLIIIISFVSILICIRFTYYFLVLDKQIDQYALFSLFWLLFSSNTHLSDQHVCEHDTFLFIKFSIGIVQIFQNSSSSHRNKSLRLFKCFKNKFYWKMNFAAPKWLAQSNRFGIASKKIYANRIAWKLMQIKNSSTPF